MKFRARIETIIERYLEVAARHLRGSRAQHVKARADITRALLRELGEE